MEFKNEQIEFSFMDNSKYIYKSNNLIESSYSLNLNEQRLIYMALKKLKPIYIRSDIKPSKLKTYAATQEFGDIKIYVNEFKKEFKISGNSLYKRLEEMADAFFEKTIQYLEEDGTFVKKRWVITCKYNKDEKYVALTFHPDLILDLLIFKNKYCEIQYDASKNFKSVYVFRIYELLKSYTYKGSRIIELNDLRHKLAIYDDNKYSSYSEFKRNILTPSIKTINKSSDIEVSSKDIRRGRSVNAVEFIISRKDSEVRDVENVEIFEQSHYLKLKEILNCELTAGEVDIITNSTIEAIREFNIDMTVYEYIKEKHVVIVDYSKKKTIDNYIGMVIKAIKNNWKPNIVKEKELDPKSFNNFEAREYDYDDLEKKLLGWD